MAPWSLGCSLRCQITVLQGGKSQLAENPPACSTGSGGCVFIPRALAEPCKDTSEAKCSRASRLWVCAFSKEPASAALHFSTCLQLHFLNMHSWVPVPPPCLRTHTGNAWKLKQSKFRAGNKVFKWHFNLLLTWENYYGSCGLFLRM